MKTPSLLPLLILFAALPAAAEPKPGERCETPFLEKVASEFAARRIVQDPRIAPKTVGASVSLALTFKDPKICDAGTWRYLAAGTPLVWRSKEAGVYWDGGDAGANAEVALLADDFFKAVDPKALKVLAAADAVIDAGVQLGFVTAAESDKSLSALLPEASGGPFGALKPKMVAPFAGTRTAKVPPEKAGQFWRKLLDETGAANGGGTAVMDFRMAVLELNAELGRLGAAAPAVKRAGDRLAVMGFMPGLPKGYVPAQVKKDVAIKDEAFGKALESLIGAGETLTLESVAPRADSLLDPVDMGLRNLIAVRAEQIKKLVEAAKSELGKTSKNITAIEVSARAATVGRTAKDNPLAEATMNRLAQTPEYARLDALYENNARDNPQWAAGEDAKAIFNARKSMQDAALSTTYEAGADGKSVVFTQGGVKTTLDSLVPATIDSNPVAKAAAASIISRYIVNGALDRAEDKAVRAALSGDGQPGKPTETGITPEERPAAQAVAAQAVAAVKKDSAGCENPKDLLRNDHEKYAARQQAAAAKTATDDQRERGIAESKEKADLADAKIICDQKLAASAAIKGDGFESPARLKAAQEARDAVINGECDAANQKIKGVKTARIKELDEAFKLKNPTTIGEAAKANLTASFGEAIKGSADALRGEYTAAGNARQGKLISDVNKLADAKKTARIPGPSRRLDGYVHMWFDVRWPRGSDPDSLKTTNDSVAACAKALGLGEEKGALPYRNPKNPDKVDEYCLIRTELAQYVAGRIGKVD